MRDLAKNISANPAVRFGRPTVNGTRVPVDLVLREMANGMTVEELMREYGLDFEQVKSVLRYAAARLFVVDVGDVSRQTIRA